jgi:hypothetical protein
MNERPLSNSLPRLFLPWIVELKFEDVQARLVDEVLGEEVAECWGRGWERWRWRFDGEQGGGGGWGDLGRVEVEKFEFGRAPVRR